MHPQARVSGLEQREVGNDRVVIGKPHVESFETFGLQGRIVEKDIVDTQGREDMLVGTAYTASFGDKGVGQFTLYPVVYIGTGHIVKVATDNNRVIHTPFERIDLVGKVGAACRGGIQLA